MFALPVQALDPTKPPGFNFNLTNFYLGLPIDSSGGTNGTSASVPAAQLTTGFTNTYFYTGSDGAMTFWAFVLGATTSGSSYPRSELREQLAPPSNSSNWIAYGAHRLNAQCRVLQVPSTGKVIIGQIHCYTGEARPLLKLQFNNGVVEALVKTNSHFDPDLKLPFQNVGLSNLISYQFLMENGLLSVSVNGSNRSVNVFQTDPDWATNGLYFKAGSYCQDNSGTTNEGARVAFYSLSREHAPSITNPPLAALVLPGSNVLFRVAATGNGPLRYQWRFYQTNIAKETAASLTVTNVQAAQTGVYSVLVSDSLGSALSADATLSLIPPLEVSAAFLRTNGSFAATLLGAPGLRYLVDRAPALEGPWEIGFTNALAGTNGSLQFIDPAVPLPLRRFYRVHYP